MSEKNLSRRIIWAVDAFAETTALQKKMIGTLRAWTKGTNILIEPVYVMSPDQLNLMPDFFASQKRNIELITERKLNQWLKNAKLPGLAKPTFLVSELFSIKSSVKALVSYAEQVGAEYIAVTSRSKKGLSRMMFGSFAETLILHSDVAVAVVTPNTKTITEPSNILFPTDFSEASRIALDEVIEFAKHHEAQITLMHRLEFLQDYAMSGVGMAPTVLESAVDTYANDQKDQLKALGDYASAKGVKVQTILVEKIFDAVSAITDVARRSKCSMIAMASRSGVVESAILGSVTRQILRTATCPVWVIHPKRAPLKKEKRQQESRSRLAVL